MAAQRWKDFWRAAFSPKYLWITNSVSCVTLLGMADVMQQMFMGASLSASLPPHYYFEHYDYEHKQYKDKDWSLDEEEEIKRINWRRTMRVSSMGFITGPMNTFWYKWLESVIKGTICFSTVSKKVAADVIISPAFDSTFIIGVATQEGKTIWEGIYEYRSKFWRILMTSACVWVPTQTINFWLVPQRFRVLYVAMVTFGYNSLLTYIKHDNEHHHSLRSLLDPNEEEARIKAARALTLPLPTTPKIVQTPPLPPPSLLPKTKTSSVPRGIE